MPSGARGWVGNLFLRTPASVRSIRNFPVLGRLLHRLSHRVLSADDKIWARIEAGPSEGLWMELNPRTGQSYLRGDAEIAVQRVLVDKLRPGMIFYDLGANIGLFSMLAARIVGPSGRVFSFEPDRETTARLERNVGRNKFRNVTIVPKGVWSTSGKRAFMPADSSSPDHGTGRFLRDGELANSLFLECASLDDFAREAPAPQGIKCDVEGVELEVLRGAEETLRNHRPWIICEMHNEANDFACRDFLRNFGYDFNDVDGHHVLATPQGV